jgi:hypothetical protein
MSEPIRDGRRLDVGTILGAVVGGAALGMLFSGVIAFCMLMSIGSFSESDSWETMAFLDWWANWLVRVDWLPDINTVDEAGMISRMMLLLWIKSGVVFLVVAKPVALLVSAKYAVPFAKSSMTGRLVAWGLVLLIFVNPPGWTLGVGVPYMFNLDAITYAGAFHVLGGAYDVLDTYRKSPWGQNPSVSALTYAPQDVSWMPR